VTKKLGVISQNLGNTGVTETSMISSLQNIQNKDSTGKILENKELGIVSRRSFFSDLTPQNHGFKALMGEGTTSITAKYCQRRTYTQNIPE